MTLQDGTTPLYVACQEGHLTIVEQLIAAKADINHQRKVDPIWHHFMHINSAVKQQLIGASLSKTALHMCVCVCVYMLSYSHIQ